MPSKAELSKEIEVLRRRCFRLETDQARRERSLIRLCETTSADHDNLHRKMRDLADLLGYEWIEDEPRWERKEKENDSL